MTPIFKCLICKKYIERSTKTFWSKKGHLLCSTCLDNIEKKNWVVKFINISIKGSFSLKKPEVLNQITLINYEWQKDYSKSFVSFFD